MQAGNNSLFQNEKGRGYLEADARRKTSERSSGTVLLCGEDANLALMISIAEVGMFFLLRGMKFCGLYMYWKVNMLRMGFIN